MRWKLKAKVQNAISLLPDSMSYSGYYWIQRKFGSLRRINPVRRLTAGVETWKKIQRFVDPSGKIFFEVGTGRIPLVPLAYWLLGAKGTITVDLNPYLRRELIAESLMYIHEHEGEIRGIFGGLLDESRFGALLKFVDRSDILINEFLNLCCIDYIAPGDASNTGLSKGMVNFHTSYTVFEHIPSETLKLILIEGNRIVGDEGIFVHRIDYSDHFSHSDKRISAINFLQYSDEEWKRYAGNRYMYMNRMRHDDFVDLFESVGHDFLSIETDMDLRAKNLLKRNFRLDERFVAKHEDALAIRSAWVLSRKSSAFAD